MDLHVHVQLLLRSVGLTVEALYGIRTHKFSERFFGHTSDRDIASKIISARGSWYGFEHTPVSADPRKNNQVLKAAGLTIGARRRLRKILKEMQHSGKTVLEIAEMYITDQLEAMKP